jgi:homoserine kinase
MQKIQVFAPASVANVSCGFDVLGFALHRPGDMVEMALNDSGVVSLDHVEGDEGRLPREADKNIVSAVVMNFLAHLDKKQGVSIRLYKQMPFGSGLGSSSASAVAGLVAINELMGKPLSREACCHLPWKANAWPVAMPMPIMLPQHFWVDWS